MTNPSEILGESTIHYEVIVSEEDHEDKSILMEKNKVVSFVELFLFNVRWILISFYIGLVIVLGYFTWSYFKILIELFSSPIPTMDDVKICVLDTIDIVMIANLVKMIITGSYNSFVSKHHGYTNENVSSGELKIKITTSVIVLAMIHLLKNFVGHDLPWETQVHQLIIFAVFLASALVLALVEYIHHK